MAEARGPRHEEAPFITAGQMREVDRVTVEDYGILLVQMMENAGRCLAQVARKRFLGGDARGGRVAVLAGTGGNGGGGLACARRLAGWGADVTVRLTRPASAFQGVPQTQLGALERMGVPTGVGVEPPGLRPGDLVIDALIGYSLRGAPSGVAASLIEAANDHPAPVLALDLPSGIDATSGEVHEPAVRAAATLTLALPKAGLRVRGARERVGELYLADIGVPAAVYAGPPLRLGPGLPFAADDIVRIW